MPARLGKIDLSLLIYEFETWPGEVIHFISILFSMLIIGSCSTTKGYSNGVGGSKVGFPVQ
jgi:hypothetical protein